MSLGVSSSILKQYNTMFSFLNFKKNKDEDNEEAAKIHIHSSVTIKDNEWLTKNCGQYYDVDIDGECVKDVNTVMRLLALLKPNEEDGYDRRVRFWIPEGSEFAINDLIDQAIKCVHEEYGKLLLMKLPRGPGHGSVYVYGDGRNTQVIYPISDANQRRFSIIKEFFIGMLKSYVDKECGNKSDHVSIRHTTSNGEFQNVEFVGAGYFTGYAHLQVNDNTLAEARYTMRAREYITNDEYLRGVTRVFLYDDSHECHNSLIGLINGITFQYDCGELVSDFIDTSTSTSTVFDNNSSTGTAQSRGFADAYVQSLPGCTGHR